MLGALWFAFAVGVGHNPEAPPDVFSDLNCSINRPDGIRATFEVTTRPLNMLKPVARHVLKDDPTRSDGSNDAQGFVPKVELGSVASSSGGGVGLAGVARGE
jgi:hypothetical protein